jgi:hypothetical protein
MESGTGKSEWLQAFPGAGPVVKKGLPQQPQASDSMDAKSSNSLVHPVYAL